MSKQFRQNGEVQAGSSTLFTLSHNGCGRATAYAEANKIVTIGEKTHVTWLDSEVDKFLVRVRTFDRKTGTWSPVYTVGEAYDNHGGPALASDSAGYLHIVYFPHHHPFRYRRSVRSNDASEWTVEVQFGKLCTYPSLVCLPDDELVLACRERTEKQWVLNLYNKLPDSDWEEPRTLFHGNASSGYTRWQAAITLGDEGRTIHMSFMAYEGEKGPGYAIGYWRSRDRGKTWERSDGAKVQLPATPATIEIVEGVQEPKTPMNLRPGNVAIDQHGTPWIIYSRLDRQPFETWLAYLSDGKWQTISLLPTIQEKLPQRTVKTPGEIMFDRDGIMYVTVTTVDANASAAQSYWGHQSAEVVLLVSKDSGRTFETFTISPPDAAVPNWLPSLERPTRHIPIGIPSLMYTHGHRGDKNTQIVSNEVVWYDVSELSI